MVSSYFKVMHVVGARPNFMKVAPVQQALGHHVGVLQIVVHTGQHYDVNMSDIFFQQLGIPMPDVNLEVGSGTHAAQTAQIMTRMETVLLGQKCIWRCQFNRRHGPGLRKVAYFRCSCRGRSAVFRPNYA